ncbi:hypothetical protein TNCV_4826561 [Trichonephila clavipes]|nr:hypothetical protein TNCV_4826561 [Trichonephila clavipes]
MFGADQRWLLPVEALHSLTHAPAQTQSNCNVHGTTFNRAAPLDWTDRGIQTRGTQAYIPFICNLRCTVVTDIAYTKGRCNHRCHTCGGHSAIPLTATTAIYRSSAGL